VTVLAGVVPAHPVIAKRVSGCPHRKCELFGADRVADVCPHLTAWMCCRQRINAHVQDTRNFRGACFSFDAIGDRNLLHAEVFYKQWRKMRHGSAGCSRENGAQGIRLLFVGALVNVGGY